jgi:hypothetical protein
MVKGDSGRSISFGEAVTVAYNAVKLLPVM